MATIELPRLSASLKRLQNAMSDARMPCRNGAPLDVVKSVPRVEPKVDAK